MNLGEKGDGAEKLGGRKEEKCDWGVFYKRRIYFKSQKNFKNNPSK